MKRRELLKLSSAALAAAPLHIKLARAAIEQENRPKRALFVFTPHGGGPQHDKPNLFQPSYSNGELSLKQLSAPFEENKEHICFIDGMALYGNPFNIGDGHKQGNRKVLTANGDNSMDIVIGDFFKEV